MAGVTLVLSILILGGVIATIGDRLGTKIGKARLSLFGMRPKKTAVAITILTGTIISFTTLGILFATNSQLRTGVFELDSIQKKLRKARRELEETQAERQRIEQERDQAREEQVAVEDRLNLTRGSLKQSIDRQQETQSRLGEVAQRAEALRNEAQRLQQEQQTLIAQRDAVAQQIAQRNKDIAQRDRDVAQQETELRRQESKLSRQDSQLSEQNSRLSQQEEALSRQTAEISERDEQIAAQREIVAQGETQLKELERTQTFLDKAILDRERVLRLLIQDQVLLREGNVALTRREVLATRVLRVLVPEASQQAINLLLQEANKEALAAIRPGIEEEIQVIQITQAQVERLKEQLNDGREYVVRILSARNYIQGEERVLVFSDVVPNEVVFSEGQLLASTSVTLESDEDFQQLQDRIGLLIESSRFRARQAGVVSERTVIGDDRIGTLVRFYEQLQDYGGTLTLQSVTSAPAYTAGPLRIHIVASRNGLEILSTDFEDN